MAAGPPSTKFSWTQYAWDNPQGESEPFGGGSKPDSNFQGIPANTPITALGAGVVSGTDSQSAWGCSVTVRLDQPFNSLATHHAYLHLSSINVNVGQRVNSGDVIGYAGNNETCGSQKVPLGFALYNGDNYGFGSAWQYMQPVLNSLLNPTPFLSQFSDPGRSSVQSTANTIDTASKAKASGQQIFDLNSLISNLGNTLPRIGKVVLGGALVLLGLIGLIISLEHGDIGKAVKAGIKYAK